MTIVLLSFQAVRHAHAGKELPSVGDDNLRIEISEAWLMVPIIIMVSYKLERGKYAVNMR